MWKSKLQTETALSTFHSEYVALAAAMRQLIVVQRVLQDLVACLSLKPKQPKIHATVHEDNASAHALANNQRLSDRSKSLNTKYHFFWEWINDGMASVVKCSKDEQRADYMTNGLVPENWSLIGRRVKDGDTKQQRLSFCERENRSILVDSVANHQTKSIWLVALTTEVSPRGNRVVRLANKENGSCTTCHLGAVAHTSSTGLATLSNPKIIPGEARMIGNHGSNAKAQTVVYNTQSRK